MSSGFITRVEHDKDEPYTVIFTTDDERKYKAIEDSCRCAIGHGKPQFQEVVRGEWIYEELDTFRKYKVTCPHCGAWYIGNYDAYDEPSDFNYCPHCGNICNPANIEWEKMQKERNGKGQADADS